MVGDQGLNFDPPIESLQEFNVSVSNYSTELGRTGGGVVQMTTKSGTNLVFQAVSEYAGTPPNRSLAAPAPQRRISRSDRPRLLRGMPAAP